MSDCGCHVEQVTSARERRVIRIALILNAAMFVVGTTAGLMASSSGLLADALDMLADAFAYAIALVAIGRTDQFKRKAALSSGVLLGVLGVAVLVDTIRRALGDEQPLGWVMIVSGAASLIVNATVLRMLAPFRKGEVHLRASWIFTRADVIANVGVIMAAGLVIATSSNIPDVVIGVAIGLYVVKEAVEILREAREQEQVR
jgi:Co/Zn/Cd efflux system component